MVLSRYLHVLVCLSHTYCLLILLSKRSLNKELKQCKAKEGTQKQIDNSNSCRGEQSTGGQRRVALACERQLCSSRTSACSVKSFGSLQPWWEDLHCTKPGMCYNLDFLFPGDRAVQLLSGKPLSIG